MRHNACVYIVRLVRCDAIVFYRNYGSVMWCWLGVYKVFIPIAPKNQYADTQATARNVTLLAMWFVLVISSIWLWQQYVFGNEADWSRRVCVSYTQCSLRSAIQWARATSVLASFLLSPCVTYHRCSPAACRVFHLTTFGLIEERVCSTIVNGGGRPYNTQSCQTCAWLWCHLIAPTRWVTRVHTERL